ncbi:MAG: multidrug transporter [Cyclobacteriaceae bacterium]|nr:multidrug transporter [Cyclobacteriaceae bacterium]MDH4295763.1 multidrug transporter [Cyclobacteriaceae bacterium]MDH5250909.1 multidrug transporter [Cyclobacteriaceae bacterium]
MHAGKNFSVKEVLLWTRRDIYSLLAIATTQTFCYVVLDWRWLSIPWLPIALLGTAVAFIVGFKNNASYDRMWEARKIWGAIVNGSRGWGIMVKDFISNKHATLPLPEDELHEIKIKFINRHFAWLAALRYSLREKRTWESVYKKHNLEYKDKWFKVSEQSGDLWNELTNHLSPDEVELVMTKTNKAAQIIAMQSGHLRMLLEKGLIEDFRHIELERSLVDFYNQQGASERIKNFPYPRQYATLNLYFTKIFVFLLPLGMLQEFDKLGGHLIWLSIPFSVLSAWIFTTMEKIGESTESPFEGSANDVPITAISRTIEIDLKEMFGYTNIPTPLTPENNILV